MYMVRYIFIISSLLFAMAAHSQTVSLSGQVVNANQAGICEAVVSLYDTAGQLLDMTVTDTGGQFTFGQVAAGANYTLKATKPGTVAHALSVADMVISARHILGLDPLEDALDRRAADVNGSTTITTLDLVRMRQHIQGLEPIQLQWRFSVAGGQTDEINLTPTENTAGLVFTGFVVGDVNRSAVVCD